ncbi:hypothetical protein STRATTON_226 [Erwinia phage vB_EamM_Stratton]|uniref:Lipoprotein n=2 Tax=Erskinevirus EaH2 TaxID=2169883 RepID=A0A1B2IH92_9CAUD|nr:hypothetical protein G173_gp126 [Erwinia phage phiEaH2]AFQ96671.1 hypothetical protein [Erwinia phage phiEaH2]ANZ50651.1 hypothetical protein STRATTON_226 [Erwinia phage vB_EamM_Stratton]
MKVLLLVGVMLLVGCNIAQRNSATVQTSTGWPFRQLDEPPKAPTNVSGAAGDLAKKLYVADVNAYAYYVYLYAKSLNNYAETQGWHPPMVAPLCEEFIYPEVHDIPMSIVLDERARTPQAISRDLSRQLKVLLINYRNDRKAVKEAALAHKATCLN